jgi:uncharacterized protein YkwD
MKFMKICKIFSAALVLTLAAGTAIATPQTAVSPIPQSIVASADSDTVTFSVSGTEYYDYAYEVLDQMNELRASVGADPLTMDSNLLDVAMQRAAETSIYWDHTRPDGTSCFTIYFPTYGSGGENIAAGQATPTSVMDSWTNSSGHYANMVNTSYKSVGIGCFKSSNGVMCWTQYFTSETPTAVSKSGTATATHSVTALESNLTLTDSTGSFSASSCSKGTTFNYTIQNTNAEWSYIKEALDPSSVTYTTSNSKVLSVNSSGLYTVVGCGSATITATVKNSDLSFSKSFDISHNYSTSWTTDTEATCTATGSKSHHCTICGDKSDVTTVAATGHSYDSGKVTKAATCTATGVKTYTCTKCSATKTETIAKIAHSYSTTWTVDTAATCTATGSKSHHCTVCGDKSDVTTVAATGHSYDSGKVTKAATCTATGVKTYTCTKCSATKTETIAKIAHSYSTSWTIDTAATCTATGSKSHHCTICGDKTDFTTIAATGHSYDSGKVTKAATCTATGVKTYTCTKCSATKTETIAKIAHTYSTTWTVDTAATCTATGSKSHHCTICGDKSDVTTVAATGHSYDSGKVTKAATCTATGVKTYTCTKCSTTKTETIAKIAHSYSTSWTVDTAATCTATGVKTYTCTKCSTTKTETIAKIAHSYSTSWTVDTEATCTATGSKSHHCTVCGDKSDVTTIAKTAHSYKATVVKPTVSAQGYTLHKCSVCGASYKDNYTAKLIIMSGTKVSGIKTSYVYTGKAIKPTVTVKKGSTKLTLNTDYTVAYKNNISTGKATVTVTGKGKYTGKITQTFNIIPKQATLSSVTSPKTKNIKVTWKKDTQATGYQVVYSTSSAFKSAKSVTVTSNSTVTKTISSLTKGKTYYVKVRSYKTIGGKKVYGAYSTVKKITCK